MECYNLFTAEISRTTEETRNIKETHSLGKDYLSKIIIIAAATSNHG